MCSYLPSRRVVTLMTRWSLPYKKRRLNSIGITTINVSWPFYLYYGNPYTWEEGLYIEAWVCCNIRQLCCNIRNWCKTFHAQISRNHVRHKKNLICPVILIFCLQYGWHTTVHCAYFRNGWVIGKKILYKKSTMGILNYLWEFIININTSLTHTALTHLSLSNCCSWGTWNGVYWTHFSRLYSTFCCSCLIHWGRDKMAAIWRRRFSINFLV